MSVTDSMPGFNEAGAFAPDKGPYTPEGLARAFKLQ